MKSSRSLSTKNTRRNARKLMSESSDDSDSSKEFSSTNMDSARAEKVFSRRKLPDLKSNLNTYTNKAEKSLFRVSDSSDSESSKSTMDKVKFGDKKEASEFLNQVSVEKLIDEESTFDNSIFKPSKNDLLKYQNILQSSDDDDQSNGSDVDVSNGTSISKKSSVMTENDESGEDCLVEEFTDKSIQSSSENTTSNESFCLTTKKIRNKQKIILDSSEESDNGQRATNCSDINNTNIILESESDNDIINSSNEIDKIPRKGIPKKTQIEMKLKELSLIDLSDSDLDTSMHCKSTVASSHKNRTFVDNVTLLNATNFLHTPLSQSSIIEKSEFEIPTENVSNVQNNHEVIISNVDGPKTSKMFLPKQIHPLLIDLTENEYNENASESSKGDSFDKSKKLTTNEFESLKMEKRKLDEIIIRYRKNIENLKNTIKITNLHLLPDRGLKLQNAILKEERLLEDATMQLENILKKLKKFPEKPKISPPIFEPPKLSNINSGLTKKAAAYIDINAMGNQALNTYRTQQTMTLDVLHSLHKSLETCPAPNILADDPSGLKVELMPHQKHAIAWLMWRESQKPYGGILADDMGLGKTLTMIALILKATEIEKTKEHSDSDYTDNSCDDTQQCAIKGGTLIICPSSLITQWQNEIKTKLRPRILDVIQHYGPNRESSARRLAKKDIVITTYHVVMWDQKKQNNSPLFQIKWKRIILDEAHCIRNYKSQTSIAVSALFGNYRWALSGTPIHNKQDDFYALLKFIKCHPFHEWAIWKRWVGNNDDAGKSRLSLLVKTLMLRRTKAELSELTSFKLPTKTFHTIDIELFKEEKEVYEKVLLFSSTLFSTYLYEKAEKEDAIKYGFPVQNKAKYLHQTNLNDNIFQDHPELDKLFKQLKNNKNIQAHHILVLLLRLRQLCCHPCLMKNMLDDETLKVDGIQDTGDIDLVDHMSRMSIGVPNIEKEALTNNNPIFKDSWVSSKVKAVCDMVKEKVLQTDDKAIIVSQWPSMLLLIGKQLSQYPVKTALFSGAVPIPDRNRIVNEFNNLNGGPKILLLSLTAGGVGLNLVAANHLFLVDIHWNPQLEAQACDRIYRVGQTKSVNVYKFICNNTIENSIQSLQSKKIALANNLFGGCKNIEGSKITLDDLKQIFNINQNNRLK